MNNLSNSATSGSTVRAAGTSSVWTMIAQDTRNGFRTVMQHALMATGIIAIAAFGFIFIKPEVIDHLKLLSPFAEEAEQAAASPEIASPLANLMAAPGQAAAQTAPTALESGAVQVPDRQQAGATVETAMVGTSTEQERVTKWLSKRYRVARDATNMLVSAAYLTAQDIKLDPLLILSVMAIESRFNPFAESAVGAQGLMQVMSKVHHEKFQKLGGVQAALNPVANIQVGAQILKEYVRRSGSVEGGLKMYVGAAEMETDMGYGSKVLAEYNWLKNVAAGKKVPISVAVAKPAPAKDAADRADQVKAQELTRAEPADDETPA